jgi:hypothetical protein
VASLKPTVFFNGMSLNPGSGTVKNFTGPVLYTVTARDGTTRSYTVTVRVTPSNTKDITRFDFPGITTIDTVIGAVPDDLGYYPIAAWVPAGVPLTNLSPVITHTGVSISPASGTAGNFDLLTPQYYTVTAEDGTTKKYKAVVIPLNTEGKIITSFIFETVPLSGGGSVRAVGSIDQGAHTIDVWVPSNADRSDLKPTLTYIGISLTDPGSAITTANPFTETTGRDFSSPKIYTVNGQSGSQDYTVTVTPKTAVSVTFEGEREQDVIATSTFNQTTGLITVTVNTDLGNGGVAPPYEWYAGGIKQGVPVTTTTFTLNVGNGSYAPGRHSIMVSGIKNHRHFTGTVYFVIAE